MLTFLAQSVFASPDPLDAPGAIELWFNQRSMLTGIGVLFVGLVLFAGPARGMKRGWLVAAGVMGLGGAIWGYGELYTSDLEAVQASTEAFYAAFEEGDQSAVDRLLASEVGIASGGQALPLVGRGFVLAGVDRAREAGIQRLAQEERQAQVFSDVSAKSQTYLRAVFSGAAPALVWVALDWRKEGEEWKVRGVDVLLINGRSPGQALLQAVR